MPSVVSTEDFGGLLKYLRKRAHLTQRDLAQAVGYTEAHLCRLEKNERQPDLTTVAALFIPALDIKNEPLMMERLLKLAAQSRSERQPASVKISQITIEHLVEQELGALEEIPAAPSHYVPRPVIMQKLHEGLVNERCVAVCGMAGVGKTTLAAAVARTHDPQSVFWHTLTAGVTTSVEAIIHQLALFFLARGQTQVRPLLEVSTQAAPLPLNQQITLLRAALGNQSVLLCFDDVHLLNDNEMALALLRNLCATTNASMLLTSRQDLSLPVTQIPLNGLDRSEAVDLLDRLGHDPESITGKLLLARADGSPMLLRLASVQLLASGEDTDGLVEHLESQPQIAAYLLNSLLHGLSAEAQWLASLVSIFRRPVNLYDEILVELCEKAGQPFCSETALELQRHFLIGDFRLAAVPPLVRDHLVGRLETDPLRKRRLHRLAAEWSERANGDILEAIYHYTRAGQIKQVMDLVAGQENVLRERGQTLAAVEVLGEALRVVRSKKRDEGNIDLLRWLYTTRGDLLSWSPQTAGAEADYREALALTTNPELRADLVCRLLVPLASRNEYTEALQLAQSALGAISSRDTLLKARLNMAIAASQYNLGMFTEARLAAEEALTLAAQFENAPWRMLEDIRAHAHFWVANTARIRREPDKAFEHTRQALASAHTAGLSRMENTMLGFMGGLLYDRGEIDESYRYRSASVSKALELGDTYWAAYSLIHISSNHYVRCETDAALAKLDQARELLEEIGDTHGLADQASQRAACLLLCGNVEAARAVMDELLSKYQTQPKPRMFGHYLNTLAMVQLSSKPVNAEGAQTTLRRALELPATQGDPMLRFSLNSTLVMGTLIAGSPIEAQEILQASLPQEGFSMWVKLDRILVSGYVALGQGNLDHARETAATILEKAGSYALYRLRAERLALAIENPQITYFPRFLWMIE